MQRDEGRTPKEASNEAEETEESGVGADRGTETDRGTALPPKLENWRRRSAAGAILTGFALGLQEALDPQRDEPNIVVEHSGEPPKDLPVEADFEYGRPRQSVVNIRPWLLDSPAPTPAEQDPSADENSADEDHSLGEDHSPGEETE